MAYDAHVFNTNSKAKQINFLNAERKMSCCSIQKGFPVMHTYNREVFALRYYMKAGGGREGKSFFGKPICSPTLKYAVLCCWCKD